MTTSDEPMAVDNMPDGLQTRARVARFDEHLMSFRFAYYMAETCRCSTTGLHPTAAARKIADLSFSDPIGRIPPTQDVRDFRAALASGQIARTFNDRMYAYDTADELMSWLQKTDPPSSVGPGARPLRKRNPKPAPERHAGVARWGWVPWHPDGI